MKDLQAQLETIAAQHLRIETLQARNMDNLDFHEVSVWSLEKALKAAFEAGQAQAAQRLSKVTVKSSA